ncbi:MAG: hypothetical protein CVV27_21760 [Candidatus Melainabacteria bacterium HGW-Melainabacteria-1]|nr:MAG: hypothetical protein CVV27_21760 [Candidatus Melainabacteria bacterium HGW-Melainabacteria-1]
MARVKKDDKFCCADCGLEVVVNKTCDCIDTRLVCCGGPMIRAKAPAGRKIPATKAAGKKTPLSRAAKKA